MSGRDEGSVWGDDLTAPALRPYQQRAVHRALNQLKLALLMRPGAGKTAIMLAVIQELIWLGEIPSALVIAPRKVARLTWPAEAKKFAPDLKVRFIGDTDAIDPLGFHVLDLSQRADIYLMHPEAIPKLFGRPMFLLPSGEIWDGKAAIGDQELRPRWAEGPWKTWGPHRPTHLVLDESTKFKNLQGGRAKTLRRFVGDFPRRNILTGSPVANRLTDIFGQMLICDDGATFGTTLGAFRSEYMQRYTVKYGEHEFTRYRTSPGAPERLAKRLARAAEVIDPADHMDFPELVFVPRVAELPPAVRKQYDEAKRQAAMELDDGQLLDMSGGAMVRWKQIANGQVYLPDPLTGETERRVVHRAKLEELRLVLAELNRPALIVYEYTHDGEMLAKELGYPIINGASTDEDDARAVEMWNAGELEGLILQPDAAAHGLNLQFGGDTLIHYGLIWDFEKFDQVNRRLLRPGQKSPNVWVYLIEAENTVDQRVGAVLSSKGADEAAVMAALKEELKSV